MTHPTIVEVLDEMTIPTDGVALDHIFDVWCEASFGKDYHKSPTWFLSRRDIRVRWEQEVLYPFLVAMRSRGVHGVCDNKVVNVSCSPDIVAARTADMLTHEEHQLMERINR